MRDYNKRKRKIKERGKTKKEVLPYSKFSGTLKFNLLNDYYVPNPLLSARYTENKYYPCPQKYESDKRLIK